jgi:cytochrome c oxidase subunit 4
MSVTEHAAHDPVPHGAEHGDHGAAHVDHSDWFYGKIAIILAVITGAEVSISYMDIGKAFMPILLILMAVKFFTVVSYFMHLKFDNRIFSWLFYSGLFLALGVYLAVLLTFHVFNGPPGN